LQKISMMRSTRLVACVALLVAAGGLSTAQGAMKGTKAQPVATIHTSMGDLTCVLFPKSAPIGTENFIGLATGTKDWTDPSTGKKMHGVPLYDNTTFHRVIPNFMIQGGDPVGTGMGGPGYDFKNEIWPDLRFDQPGRLAYANAGPNTNGSQFFITLFGQCDAESVASVQKIARVQRNAADRPMTPVVIKHIEIDDGSKSAHK
jgi:peptidyl-prolyl cis-trans isomerase A (cyclophilin A)